MKISPAMRNQS